MKIAISKSNSGFQKYLDWLKFFNVDYSVFDWEENESLNKFKDYDGLILTGGIDIHPSFYGDMNDEESLFAKGRDEFEMNLLDKAIKDKKPVLCICRGMQLLNIYFGGNLITDLEQVKGVNHRKISDTEVRMHNVNVEKDSLLYNIVNTGNGFVTSTHHQAVDKVGDKLIVNAVSDDGVIEGIEFEDKSNKGFLIGVQWHPERFNDYNNPFSQNILKSFIKETGNS